MVKFCNCKSSLFLAHGYMLHFHILCDIVQHNDSLCSFNFFRSAGSPTKSCRHSIQTRQVISNPSTTSIISAASMVTRRSHVWRTARERPTKLNCCPGITSGSLVTTGMVIPWVGIAGPVLKDFTLRTKLSNIYRPPSSLLIGIRETRVREFYNIYS